MKNLANFWNTNRLDLQMLLACLISMTVTCLYMGWQEGHREAEEGRRVQAYCASAHPIESLCKGALNGQ